MAGSGKIFPHSPKGWLAVMSNERRSYRALVQPNIPGTQCHDLRFGDHRDGLEVEVVQCLSGHEPGFFQVTLDATSASFGDFVLSDSSQEAGSGPPFFIRSFGELWPNLFD